jgi:hypothetical protein
MPHYRIRTTPDMKTGARRYYVEEWRYFVWPLGAWFSVSLNFDNHRDAERWIEQAKN